MSLTTFTATSTEVYDRKHNSGSSIPYKSTISHHLPSQFIGITPKRLSWHVGRAPHSKEMTLSSSISVLVYTQSEWSAADLHVRSCLLAHIICVMQTYPKSRLHPPTQVLWLNNFIYSSTNSGVTILLIVSRCSHTFAIPYCHPLLLLTTPGFLAHIPLLIWQFMESI